MGKRKHTHLAEDQYGEFRSQDRDEGFSKSAGSRGGLSGGGSAGGGRKGADVQYERQVPKFLQPYKHMLGQQQQQQQGEDDPVVVACEGKSQRAEASDDEQDAHDGGDAEAIQRALQENPELAAELGDKYLTKVQANEQKELGNEAFAKKRFEAAIKHFTKALELDPNLGRFEEALADAKQVLARRPGWVKGHARLAAALYGLQHYSEARQAYEKALKLEPDDQALQKGRDKATGMELQHMRDKKHIFKRGSKRPAAEQKQGAGSEKQQSAAVGSASSRAGAAKARAVLSFGGDEEDENAG